MLNTTIYTFHSAHNHSIVAAIQEDGHTLARHALAQAANDAEKQDGKTRRYYVHNGTGVVAAFMTRGGKASQILHDDYRRFSDEAVKLRTEAEINA